MASWNGVTPEEVVDIKEMLAAKMPFDMVVKFSKRSPETIRRVMDGYYDRLLQENKEEGPEKPISPPWDSLLDAQKKILYELCLVNDQLKQLLEALK